MTKKLLLSLMCLLCIVFTTIAQETTISGRVVDIETGEGLPGVSIFVKGTSTGTITDVSGNYSIRASVGATLVFQAVGLANMEVIVGNQSTIDVQMKSNTTELGEVIVTALGIERDKRSLGYAVQEIKTESLEQKGTNNVLSTLQGKIAGVQITGASGAPGASTNINIRGISSFSGSNQPLFIIDGIPVSNSTDAFGNTLFSAQASNRGVDINPDLVESITILKGPAASVLYGSRAANGAVIITTKAGKINRNQKTSVTVTSSVVVNEVYGLPKYQNDYGQGSLGLFNELQTASWGPRFGTIDSVTYSAYGRQVYQAYPNNVEEFYRTGRTFTNGVSLSGASEKSGYSLSLSYSDQDGIIPNSEFSRLNAQFGGNTELANGLLATASVSYTKSTQDGTALGNGGSAFGQLTRIPRSFDLNGLPYTDPITGRSLYFSPTINNPNWAAANITAASVVDRINGNFTLAYNVTKWLNVKYRLGIDTYTDRRKNISRLGAARNPNGIIEEELFYRSEINGDLLITLSKENLFTEGFSATLLLGQNINQRRFQNTSVVAENLVIPDYFNVNNATQFTNSGEANSIQRLLGYYGQLSLSYKEYLFLELTGRFDQSSTLPKSENTYFYPSVSVGFIFTEVIKVNPKILSYGKIRANIARVGKDADPYLLQNTFATGSYGNNLASINYPLTTAGGTVPGFSVSNRIAPVVLTPEFTTSYEVGINLGFWENRISLDFTYFNSESKDQILNVAVPTSTGFSTRTTNIGVLTNKGIEVLLNATPLEIGDFKWDISLNFTRIRNKATDLPEGLNQFPILGDGFIGITPSVVKDEPYGVIVSTALPRNENGDILINPATGAFAAGIPGSIVADPNPDWLGGVTNTFSYKGINLSILFDTQQGGDIYSFSAVDLRSGGHLYMTGVDRDQPRILPGVIDNGDGTFRPNNIQISSQAYWQGLGGLASESAVFDATRYSLREITLGYSLPKSILSKTPFGDVTISLVGRNLWFYAPGFPMDPEINTQGAGNIRGLDLNGPPNTRNYGVNLKFSL